MQDRETTVVDNIKFIVDELDINNLDHELLKKVINKHKVIVNGRYNVLDNYYKGKHNILNRVLEDKDKPNNRSVTNYCAYMADMLTGFFMGKPVDYHSENKELLNNIKTIMKENDEASHNHDLASKAGIKGTAYELVYLDEEGKLCFDALDTDSLILIYDNSIKSNIRMAIRYYEIGNTFLEEESKLRIEIYTLNKILVFEEYNDNLKLILENDHYFLECPIIEYANNRYRASDFEAIINLNDKYNKNMSDIANDIEYFVNCYLHLSGMEANDEDINKMKENRVLITPENSDAKFLIKQINDAVVYNFRKSLNEDIHKTAYVPDLSQDLPANLSGSAIKNKFFSTEQAIGKKERQFKKGLEKRLRLIIRYLNLKGHSYSKNDIEIQFNRNLPLNLIEFSQMASQVNGVLPREMTIELLNKYGLEIDVNRAMEMIEKEKEMYSIDNSIPDLSFEGDIVE